MGEDEPRKKKKLYWVIPLLIICVCVSELIVCRYADPALYEKIMTPVEQGLQKAYAMGASAVDSAKDWVLDKKDWLVIQWEKQKFPVEESQAEPESQKAQEPEFEKGKIADFTITELVERDGRQVLTGGTVELTYFNQTDPRWGDQPYGVDPINSYACGPTAMAMIVSSMTDRLIDPLEMSGWAYRNGYYARHSGSYHSIVGGTAAAYGLKAEAFRPKDTTELLSQFSSGKMMVALMTKGHFTNSGHFILLRGATLDGLVLVADPHSLERSLQTWDPQIILDELSKSTDSGAPLWVISPPE